MQAFEVRHILTLLGVKPHRADQMVDSFPLQRATDVATLRQLVAAVLSAHHLSYPPRDMALAVEIQARRRPLVFLLGGTSGCGKSTLASLLAARIGITTMISTDAIRHALRSQPDAPRQLFTSTYEASLEDYGAQCACVVAAMVPIVRSYVARRIPVIVEGVHLLPTVVAAALPELVGAEYVVRCVVHISNADKHRERFATRAKYMTLEPRVNRYVKHFDCIRAIQDELCRQAQQWEQNGHWHLVDNTNVDRSVAVVHAKIFGRELTAPLSGKKMLQAIHEAHHT
jgi:2-phosphoglycerate kinase